MSSNPPPPHFTSGGGYHDLGIGYNHHHDATIFPMPEDYSNDHQQEYHHYHHYEQQQQQQQHMLDKLSQESQLQQKIAKSLLTPRLNNNNTNNINASSVINDDDVLFGMDDVPITFMNPKPWEEDAHKSQYYGGDGGAAAAQFPAMGPFPTGQLAVATATPAATARINNTINNNNAHHYQNGPSSTKSVTFNTHDEFHSWDPQLDQLLHVDEEFFNVAHFLLEVVNNGSVHNLNDEDDDGNIGRFFNGEEEDENNEYYYGQETTADYLTPVNDGIGKMIAKFFTFECGTATDVVYNTYGQEGSVDQTSNNNNGTSLGGEKKYKLTKKLVRDFEQALKFRMENIESNESLLMGGGMESELVTRTRKIAEKVEAYGLPGKPPSDERISQQQQQQPYENADGTSGQAAYGDCYEVDCDEVEEEFKRTVEVPRVGKRRKPRHFPILPTDEDEEALGKGGMNEDERLFYNTFGNISKTMNETAQKCNPKSPFQSVCKLFSTLVGPKTSAPSNEECQIRLQQIQREISNATKMMEGSRCSDVISACDNRIKRLKDEERMYQIFKEISKIQKMVQTTELESVKKACSQRLYQLTAELKAIDLSKYDEELEVKEDVEENFIVVDDVENDIIEENQGPVATATGEEEDLDWYERAQRYVRVQEPQNPVRSSTQRHYHPQHLQSHQQHYPQQHYSKQYASHPGYASDAENYYDRLYPEKQQYAPPSSHRRVLSPRNGRPHPTNLSRPHQLHPQY